MDESNIYILSTLLLISIFKNIYGIITSPSFFNYLQLHIYSYIFLVFSIILTMDSIGKPLFFSFFSYLIGLYSANEISKFKTFEKFNITIFMVWLSIIFIGAFISMYLTSKIAPLIPLGSIGLVIAWTLGKIKKENLDDETQGFMLLGIIIFSFILYYILTGKVFIIDQLFEIIKPYLTST